ncbi:hypothetical protein WAI453_007036 [Rhynchosporium graminicola]
MMHRIARSGPPGNFSAIIPSAALRSDAFSEPCPPELWYQPVECSDAPLFTPALDPEVIVRFPREFLKRRFEGPPEVDRKLFYDEEVAFTGFKAHPDSEAGVGGRDVVLHGNNGGCGNMGLHVTR